MAELAVTAAMGALQIIPLAIEHMQIAEKEKSHIESMQSWLGSTMAFIEDNDGLDGSKTLEEHMRKVRDIAYDIEDVVEEIILQFPPNVLHKHDISRKIHHIAHHVKHMFQPTHGLFGRIESINQRIEDIRKQRQAFPDGYSTKRSSARSIPMVALPLNSLQDQEMDGYEVEKKDFIRLLEDGGDGLARLAVVGPSGSGKTTFLKNAFFDRKIRAQFECYAWVHVGRQFDILELFRNLLKQLGLWNNSIQLDQEESLNMLRDFLPKKGYFVVLDDIWNGTDWDSIWKPFSDASEGKRSRVVVTTRSLSAATVITAPIQHHIFTLEGLGWEQGWKLFCKKAFPSCDGKCPSELKESSMRIVKRCDGLPLAIVAVASSLSHKPLLPIEWKKFDVNLGSEVWQESSNLILILNALLPSYMDLSSNIKSCFLYFSIFPEDYAIQRGRLICLWVAEGFAIRTQSRSAEDVAEGYLNELIHRNLVHVSEWDFDGRPGKCRVLSLVLKFIVQKCEDENFASIFTRENASQSHKIRRMSVHSDCTDLFVPLHSDFSGVRSIFLMRLLGTTTSDFNQHLRRMRLLRVFDFQFAPLTEFPKGITDLILLKYLSFRGTKIKTIPSAIEKFCYLETFDLMETEVRELPKEISHLHNLCHLFASKCGVNNTDVFNSVEGVKMHNGIGNLTDLQELSFVKVDERGQILKELSKLKQLRELGLTGLRRDHGQDLCAAVKEMESLRTLDVCTITEQEYLELEEVEIPPQTLQRLHLKGRMAEFPTWISSLDNLLRIDLKWTKLQNSPLGTLKQLPNLVEFHMFDCYIGEELIFETSCFKKLKVLVIEELVELHTLVIEDGAMPDLKELSVIKCPRLKMCLLGINKLDKIEKLNLHHMDEDQLVGVTRMGSNHAKG